MSDKLLFHIRYHLDKKSMFFLQIDFDFYLANFLINYNVPAIAR
jgi:hypothetical protein